MNDNVVMLNLAKVQQLFLKQNKKLPVFNPQSSKRIELIMERSLSPKNQCSLKRIQTQSSHTTLTTLKDESTITKIEIETNKSPKGPQSLHKKLRIQNSRKHSTYSNLHNAKKVVGFQDGYCGLSAALKFGSYPI